MKLLRLLFFTGIVLAAPLRASAVEVSWRPFGRAAFVEAERRGVPVLLWLSAPWNRDHFLFPRNVFSQSEVVDALDSLCVPVHADVSVYTELRELYAIDSRLVPSVHFLDAEGARLSSFPPLGAEELIFYATQAGGASAPALEPGGGFEINGKKLANRLARLVLDELSSGNEPVHLDWRPATLSFLLEFGIVHPRREVSANVRRQVARILEGQLYDPVHGGFHRAWADPARQLVHHEKLLRQNAEMGATLATLFRMTRDASLGEAALKTLRFVNEQLRTQGTTLYLGSQAADVFDGSRTRIVMEGSRYYRLRDREGVEPPPVSEDVPVGANFVFHQAMLDYARAFRDVRMWRAAKRGVPRLLALGMESDGTVRRELGKPGVGNLRDQADAGSGLLAYHALTGDPEGISAATRLADAVITRFWDDEERAFRTVATDADVPAFVREAPPSASANGEMLRFLSDLAATTRDSRWADLARESLQAWASRIPLDGNGLAELGRAALRAETELPVLVITADPALPGGHALRDLALGLRDRLVTIRWIDRNRPDQAAAYGIDLEYEPAIYLVWDRPTPAIRDAVTLSAAYHGALERVIEDQER